MPAQRRVDTRPSCWRAAGGSWRSNSFRILKPTKPISGRVGRRAVHRRSVQRDALPLLRHRHPSARHVEDPAGDGQPVVHQADDHGEAILAGGEVRGAVQRIDDPAGLAGAADQVEQAAILLDGLLAHHRHAGQDPGQAGSQPLLGCDVGHGDDVAGPLEADVFLGERAKARQQLRRRGLAHQLGDPLRIAGAQHRVSRRRRTGPLPSGSRARRRRASLRCPTICRRSPCRRP